MDHNDQSRIHTSVSVSLALSLSISLSLWCGSLALSPSPSSSLLFHSPLFSSLFLHPRPCPIKTLSSNNPHRPLLPRSRTQIILRRSASAGQPASLAPNAEGISSSSWSPNNNYNYCYYHSLCRLKLRCDRAIPCGSCQKRGCAAICPDGACPRFAHNHAS